MQIDQFFNGFLSQIWVDGAGTIPQQRCKMMYFSWLCTLKDHSNCCSLLCSDKIMLKSRYSQQGRNRHMVLINASVGKNQNIHTVSVSSVYFHKQMIQCTFKGCIDIVSDRNCRYFESFYIHGFDLQQICIRQYRIVDLNHLAVFSFFFQKIAVRSDINRCRCHNFLTDGIDWRIGYLCKHLFKIRKQWLRLIAQNRKRCIHTHGSNWLCTIPGHRKDGIL